MISENEAFLMNLGGGEGGMNYKIQCKDYHYLILFRRIMYRVQPIFGTGYAIQYYAYNLYRLVDEGKGVVRGGGIVFKNVKYMYKNNYFYIKHQETSLLI